MMEQEIINNWEPTSDGLKIAKLVQEHYHFFGNEDLYITLNDPEMSFVVSTFSTSDLKSIERSLKEQMNITIDYFGVSACGVNSRVLVHLNLRQLGKEGE